VIGPLSRRGIVVKVYRSGARCIPVFDVGGGRWAARSGELAPAGSKVWRSLRSFAQYAEPIAEVPK
jgi:hypothetical protein